MRVLFNITVLKTNPLLLYSSIFFANAEKRQKKKGKKKNFSCILCLYRDENSTFTKKSSKHSIKNDPTLTGKSKPKNFQPSYE